MTVSGSGIERVGVWRGRGLPRGTRVIDATDKYLMPGMIDLHVHIYHPDFVLVAPRGSRAAYGAIIAANNLRSSLEAGITTVRDVGSSERVNLAMRTAAERGMVIAPRIFTAGMAITMTGGHGSGTAGLAHEADGPHEICKAVREEVKAGADLIKLFTSARSETPEFTQEELDAAVNESHRLGRRVAIHAASRIGIGMAARAGVDTIEHGTFIDEEAADIILAKGCILVPTIWVYNYVTEILHRAEKDDTSHSDSSLDDRGRNQEACWFDRSVKYLPQAMEIVRAKGIPVGGGTDAVFAEQPWALLPKEAESLVALGFENLDVITAITRTGARALGMEHVLGTIESGKYADLVLLEGDPIVDISNLHRVSLVMKGGRIIDRKQGTALRAIRDPLEPIDWPPSSGGCTAGG